MAKRKDADYPPTGSHDLRVNPCEAQQLDATDLIALYARWPSSVLLVSWSQNAQAREGFAAGSESMRSNEGA